MGTTAFRGHFAYAEAGAGPNRRSLPAGVSRRDLSVFDTRPAVLAAHYVNKIIAMPARPVEWGFGGLIASLYVQVSI